jgi:hypothetical protein
MQHIADFYSLICKQKYINDDENSFPGFSCLWFLLRWL